MKKLLILSAMGLASASGMAQDFGRVLSATPMMQQVAVPRQICNNETVPVSAPKSGAGAAMGAIAGGALGNAVGHGGGQVAATVLGVIGGAVLGDHIEGAPQTQYQTVQNCTTQSFYESRPVGYNVVYEYAGKQYTVQMPNDPGPTVQLQVSPVASSAPVQVPARIVSSTTYVQPVDQVTVVPAAPVVYQQPYYYGSYVAPLAIGIGLGYIGGHWGRGYGGYRGGYHRR